jgi:hypothetical protein
MGAKQTLASIAASIEGINTRLSQMEADSKKNFDALTRQIATNYSSLVKRVADVFDLVKLLQERITGLEQRITVLEEDNKEIKELLRHLIKEVGALKHTDGKLMVTCFAFASQEGLTFSQGDLAVNSRAAQRYCNRHRIRYSRVSDPRFGYVNVYPREVLEQLFLQEDSEEYVSWVVSETTGARY